MMSSFFVQAVFGMLGRFTMVLSSMVVMFRCLFMMLMNVMLAHVTLPVPRCR